MHWRCLVVLSVVEWDKRLHQAGNGGNIKHGRTTTKQTRKRRIPPPGREKAKEVRDWVASKRKVPMEGRRRWRVRKQGRAPCSTEMGGCHSPCRATRNMARSNSRQQYSECIVADGNPGTQQRATTMECAVQYNHWKSNVPGDERWMKQLEWMRPGKR